MSAFLPVEEQLNLILRGASQIETVEDLRKKLEKSRETGKPLRVKYGIDPTGFDVHLGHTVPLRKLRQFQQLGHLPVLIIGTATAEVGDPSGRDEARKSLTTEQIARNAETYLQQISKVIDITKAEVRPNGEWFHRFNFAAMLRLLGQMTVQQMLAREDFANRITAKTPIYLHECLYPLMQGHDSVEIQADVELGGTEQLFNLMVGRELQKSAAQAPQVAFTMPILRGLDGEKKMGKSLGNYIGLAESAKDQFGKTMRIPDELMPEWFTLLTDFTPQKLQELRSDKPNEAKKILGAEIVRFYYGDQAAQDVLDDWKRQFENKGDPIDMPEIVIPTEELENGQIGILKLLTLAGFCKSNSEARKKVEEGAVNYGPDKAKPADYKSTLEVTDGLVLRLGRKVVKLKRG